MQAEVILSPAEAKHHDFTGKTCVVIDVFRFTTTVLTALEAGIERFFPVGEVEEALKLKEANPRLLLGGERQALKIPGFDFGNSPLEHFGQHYVGGELICSTTNGTRAIQAARGASQVVLASLRSAKAVAEHIQGHPDLLFLPAGLRGKFSLEDTWCAGLILSYLQGYELRDGARVAQLVYEQTPLEELRDSEHGKRLQDLNLWDDLDFCLECNVSSGVVVWDQKSGWGTLG
ncbi:MAG: 2-phosphosulfolactate phosphatase [Firmicutes bacterium]|nr:2-phosphosulfolactate phosphatase [Bacillota bacterium]